jgi:hypothetical protein
MLAGQTQTQLTKKIYMRVQPPTTTTNATANNCQNMIHELAPLEYTMTFQLEMLATSQKKAVC